MQWVPTQDGDSGWSLSRRQGGIGLVPGNHSVVSAAGWRPMGSRASQWGMQDEQSDPLHGS